MQTLAIYVYFYNRSDSGGAGGIRWSQGRSAGKGDRHWPPRTALWHTAQSHSSKPDPGRSRLWGPPDLTFLICTWKAAPLAGAAGCMRPEKLVHRSENKMHIPTQGQDTGRKGKQDIILCFRRHLHCHSDLVAHSSFRHEDHRGLRARPLSLTSFLTNPDQHSVTSRTLSLDPRSSILHSATHVCIPTNAAPGPRDHHQAEGRVCITSDPLWELSQTAH